MGRKSLALTFVLALSSISSCIHTPTQQDDALLRENATNQAHNAEAITDQENESHIRAIAQELRTLGKQDDQADQARTEQDGWWFGDRAPLRSNWALATIAFIAGGVAYFAFTHLARK